MIEKRLWEFCLRPILPIRTPGEYRVIKKKYRTLYAPSLFFNFESVDFDKNLSPLLIANVAKLKASRKPAHRVTTNVLESGGGAWESESEKWRWNKIRENWSRIARATNPLRGRGSRAFLCKSAPLTLEFVLPLSRLRYVTLCADSPPPSYPPRTFFPPLIPLSCFFSESKSVKKKTFQSFLFTGFF